MICENLYEKTHGLLSFVFAIMTFELLLVKVRLNESLKQLFRE